MSAPPTGVLFNEARAKPLSTTGAIQPGAYYQFYLTGTTTPTNVYADGSLVTPLSQTPGTGATTAAADGRLVPMYMNPAITYRYQLYSATAVLLEDVDPYIPAPVPTQAQLGAVLYPQTTAEIAASVTPSIFSYPEGDIRRYGATTASANNSGAISTALSVSGAGGANAYIPAGTWSITSSVVCVVKSSMRGEGPQSVIQPTTAIDALTFPADSTPSGRRYFKQFSIISTNGGANSGISCTASPLACWYIDFSELSIQNFKTAIFASGFRVCTFNTLIFVNNYIGINMFGQNTNCEIWGCQMIRGSITGTGISAGIWLQIGGGLSTESQQITNSYIFGYDYAIKHDLGFETQVIGCDLSNSLIKGVEVTGVIGGFWLEDCYIQVINAAQLFGVDVVNITPTTTSKVHINRNYLEATTPLAGCVAIHVGNSNAGVMVEGNHMVGFDKGIDLGAITGGTCRANTINIHTSVYTASSFAVRLNSSAVDFQLGPNYIVPNTPQAATMAGSSVNIGVASSTLFPVGSPVQFDAAVNGFFIGVTYYVLTSVANVLTVSPTPGGTAVTSSGSTAINIFQAPLPLTLTGGCPTGFSFFARGSFIGKLSDPVLSGPIDWVANGYTCSFNARATASLAGASGSTAMTMTGQPSFLAPITTQNIVCQVEDSGAFFYGLAQYTAANAWTYFKAPGGAGFTASGTKGVQSLPMTYTFT